MARTTLFTMRINSEERDQIAQLAQQEQRPASDVVRRLIRQALKNQERAPDKPGAFAISAR